MTTVILLVFLAAASSNLSITAYSQLSGGGTFDCTNWDCTNTLSPSSIYVDSNGTAEIRQSNPSACDYTNSYFDTMLRGSFPWGTTTGTSLPSGITKVSATVDFLSKDLSGSCGVPGSRYHLFIALYYQLSPVVTCPSGGTGANGACWLDTQVRVENVGGVDSPIGTTGTYTSQAIGWDNVTLQLSPAQTGTLSGDVTYQAHQDLVAYGLPSSTPYTLMGVEIGTEGYGFNAVNTNWFNVNLEQSNLSPPLSASFTVTPGSLQPGQAGSFSATATGGTPPYSYSWKFGDGVTGLGQVASHSYSAKGNYTVALNVTDFAGQSTTASQNVTVPSPNSANFTMSVFPPSLAVLAGQSGLATLTVGSLNGFGDNVSLSARVVPSISISLSPYKVSLLPGSSQNISVNVLALYGMSPGTYSAVISGLSSNSVQSTSLTIDVASPGTNHPPTMMVPAFESAVPGSGLTFTVTATDPDQGDVVILSGQQLPSGASFNSSTGVFSWTPLSTQTGNYTITFTATDDGSPPMMDSKSVTITVGTSSPSGACLPCQVSSFMWTNFWWIGGGILAGLVILSAVSRLRLRPRAFVSQCPKLQDCVRFGKLGV